ncbi:MAG TPA: hypothetical protein VGR95_21000 [Thermoanaerobaculia bacterium]|nr:hypothetical protein [Thermoanaerobaculia bacterium]
MERRLSCGSAVDEADQIVASQTIDSELIRACDAELDSLRDDVDENARVRLVATARRVRGAVMTEKTMTITIGGVSIVGRDASVLRRALEIPKTIDRTDLPIIWRDGSGAVLLHEAIGHAAEHDAAPVTWPSWLRVNDVPRFAFDDVGAPAKGANLMTEPPQCMRRESFRDVPLRRMTNVLVRQTRAPFALPAKSIDVHLVAGGAYDPLTDVVTIHIAASSAGAFTFRRTRAEVAKSLAGAKGAPVVYPGVICSREGQELAVGSAAPVMITE